VNNTSSHQWLDTDDDYDDDDDDDDDHYNNNNVESFGVTLVDLMLCCRTFM